MSPKQLNFYNGMGLISTGKISHLVCVCVAFTLEVVIKLNIVSDHMNMESLALSYCPSLDSQFGFSYLHADTKR